MSESVKFRIALEKAITRELVASCVIAGFVPVSVWDGGSYEPQGEEDGRKVTPRVLTADEVVDAVFAVDDATIHFAPVNDLSKWGALGVAVIGGNGRDFISDRHVASKYPAFGVAVDRVDGEAIEDQATRAVAVQQRDATRDDLLEAAEFLDNFGAGEAPKALAARLRARAG